jgi:hypothetical protein
MSKSQQGILLSLVTLLMIYVGIYAVLTINGRYEPEAMGASGVKWYGWWPRGFMKYEDSRRLRLTGKRVWMMNLYLPLLWCDREYWHRMGGESSGKYPVNPWMHP